MGEWTSKPRNGEHETYLTALVNSLLTRLNTLVIFTFLEVDS